MKTYYTEHEISELCKLKEAAIDAYDKACAGASPKEVSHALIPVTLNLEEIKFDLLNRRTM